MPKGLSDLVAGRYDADIAVRMRRHDPESVGLLYDRYGKGAYSLAFRVLGDSAWAESVVAEAILKCWNRIASFKETRGSALGIWLLLTTYSNALDHRRASDSRVAERLEDVSSLEDGAIFYDWGNSLDTDRVQEILNAMEALDEQEKALLDLAFFEGLNSAELALRLDRTLLDVDQVVTSALSKLAAII